MDQENLVIPPTAQPLVSVLIPVLNAERFLGNALASVESQTYPALEILVVAGPSTDDTERIARSFPRVRYMEQTGSNMFNALNEGLDAAQGEFIAILSSDDVWTSDKVETQVEYLQHHPETQCVFGLTRHVLIEGEIPHGFRTEYLEGEQAAMYLEAMLARKTVFDRVGKFDETFRQASDTDWFARLGYLQLRRDFIPRALLQKGMHANNLSHEPTLGANLYHELLVTARAQTLRHRNATADV